LHSCSKDLRENRFDVYEPAGNVDGWRVVGDETMIALVVVRGTVELLAADGSVRHTAEQLADGMCRQRQRARPVLPQPFRPSSDSLR
jgi:hypothetical protein